MTKAMKVLQIRITDAEQSRIKIMAAKAGVSMSELLRHWINSGGPVSDPPPVTAETSSNPPQPEPEVREVLRRPDPHIRPDGRIIRDWHRDG